MEELDLFYHAVDITVQAPLSQCDYIGIKPYYYSVAPIGEEPSAVLYNVVGGSLADPTPHLSGIDVGDDDPDIYYYFSSTAEWVSHGDLYGTAALETGDLRCPYDYSDVVTVANGKNCCWTQYYQYAQEDNDPDFGYEDWGGNYSDCFRGAGIQDWDETSGNGFPTELILHSENSTMEHTFEITPAIQDDELEEQVSVANYFEGDDESDAPRALQDGNPYYWYKCYDHNREVQYRINVMVREWNTANERPDGDPDVGGVEDYFSDEGNNDEADWGDSEGAWDLADFGFSYDGNAGTADIDNFLSNVTAGDVAAERWLGFAQE